MNLRSQRQRLGLTQSRLARLAGVNRISICLHELGDRPLREDERRRVQAALRGEAVRLVAVGSGIGEDLAMTP